MAILADRLPDEQSPLLVNASGSSSPASDAAIVRPAATTSHTAIARIVLVLLIGVFVSNADGSLIMATYPTIASEFNSLASAGWLLGSFVLASAATQTLYGKLSDIYGRKYVVLASYLLFTGGSALVGLGQSMFQVVLGRAISGAGGAGMVSLVSVLISDLLPIHEVATWRSYVNVAATTGRSLGAPIGGWLADAIGWRWSFLGQVPLMLLAIALVVVCLPSQAGRPAHAPTQGRWASLRRIDFLGSLLLALALLALLLPMQIGGVQVPWTHPVIPSLLVASVALLVLFFFVEHRAAEPVVPLALFRVRDANFALLTLVLQTAAQVGLMYSVPIYFRVSQGASNTLAGAHLLPAVIGNAAGGVFAGIYIKRTGHYRIMNRLSALISAFSYTLLLLRWHGHTNLFESIYIFPGGFGTGMSGSAAFIAVQAVINPANLAPAISLFYLAVTCALVIALTFVSSITQVVFKMSLGERLVHLGLDAIQREEASRITYNALSSIDYILNLTGSVKDAVVGAYIQGLFWSHAASLVLVGLAFIFALLLGEKPLIKAKARADEEVEP